MKVESRTNPQHFRCRSSRPKRERSCTRSSEPGPSAKPVKLTIGAILGKSFGWPRDLGASLWQRLVVVNYLFMVAIHVEDVRLEACVSNGEERNGVIHWLVVGIVHVWLYSPGKCIWVQASGHEEPLLVPIGFIDGLPVDGNIKAKKNGSAVVLSVCSRRSLYSVLFIHSGRGN